MSTLFLTSAVLAALVTAVINIIVALLSRSSTKLIEQSRQLAEFDTRRFVELTESLDDLFRSTNIDADDADLIRAVRENDDSTTAGFTTAMLSAYRTSTEFLEMRAHLLTRERRECLNTKREEIQRTLDDVRRSAMIKDPASDTETMDAAWEKVSATFPRKYDFILSLRREVLAELREISDSLAQRRSRKV